MPGRTQRGDDGTVRLPPPTGRRVVGFRRHRPDRRGNGWRRQGHGHDGILRPAPGSSLRTGWRASRDASATGDPGSCRRARSVGPVVGQERHHSTNEEAPCDADWYWPEEVSPASRGSSASSVVSGTWTPTSVRDHRRRRVVGTSAGSAVAAQITSGTAIEVLYGTQLSRPRARSRSMWTSKISWRVSSAAASGAQGAEDMRRRIGAPRPRHADRERGERPARRHRRPAARPVVAGSDAPRHGRRRPDRRSSPSSAGSRASSWSTRWRPAAPFRASGHR